MNQNPYDDEADNMTDEDGQRDTASKPYRPKRARDPLILMLAMLVFAIIAITGILIAVTGDHKDPNAITLPVHTTKSLDQDQPRSSAEAVPVEQEQVVEEEFTTDMVLDREELPSSKIEELEQHESPIQLKNPMQQDGAKTPDITPVPEFSPQGLILNRPQNMTVHNLAPQAVEQAQKKTVQSKNPVKPVTVSTKNPLVVIVIDDMGLNQRNSKRVVALDAAITLAYLPYAERLPEQTQNAFARGHELIVHVPMEPDNVARNNPGPNALLTTLSEQENVTRLNKNLQAFDQYIGLNNHMGSKMTADAEQMRPIMRAIKAKGLWFLDSKTIGHSIAGQIAEEEGVPFAVRDVFLDNVHDVNYVLGQLRETEKVANTKGYAIAIGHPHDATIVALQQWLPQAQSRGVMIVPLSTIIAKRFPHVDMPRYARTRKASLPTQTVKRVDHTFVQ